MGQRLFARCLGEPTLLDAAYQPIRLRVRKHVALVLFLVLEPRHRATRERLKRLLWPDGNSAQSLSQAIVEIRRGLGDALFEVTDHHLALRPTADVCTDLQVLGTGSADLMIRELSQSFWSHVLFDGFEFEDAEEWNTWLHLERARWREKLGRMAEEVVARPRSPNFTSVELQRLRCWSAVQLGRRVPDHRETTLELHWHDADPRPAEVSRVILEERADTTFLLHSHASDDAMAVFIAGARRAFDRIVVGEVDGGSTPEMDRQLISLLIRLPGSVGASPESLVRLRAFVESTDVFELADVPSMEALHDVVDAIIESTTVVLIAHDEPSELMAQLAGRRGENHRVIVVVDSINAFAYSAAAAVRILNIGALSAEQMLEALTIAGMRHRPLDYPMGDLARVSRGSVALAFACMKLGPRELGPNVRLLNGPREIELVDELAAMTLLPLQYCRRMAIGNQLTTPENLSRPRLDVVITGKHDNDHDPLANLNSNLIIGDESDLLQSIELAYSNGHAVSNTMNAVLLATRTWCGLAHHDVVAEQMCDRIKEVEATGEKLEPEETLAYSMLLSTTSLTDRANLIHHPVKLAGRAQNEGQQLALTTSRLLEAQSRRDLAAQARILRGLQKLRFDDPSHQLTAAWVVEFGSTLGRISDGDYLQAYRQTAAVCRIAKSIPRGGRNTCAMAIRMVMAFRLGHYSEVAALSYHLGTAALVARARGEDTHALVAVRARMSTGDKKGAYKLRDAVAEACENSESGRSLLLSAEYLDALGCHRRAAEVGAAALARTGPLPIKHEEGIWSKWAQRFLSDQDYEYSLQHSAENAATIDVRDRQLIMIHAQTRGMCTQRLVELGFARRVVPASALI